MAATMEPSGEPVKSRRKSPILAIKPGQQAVVNHS
jgi:hypothetical protein